MATEKAARKKTTRRKETAEPASRGLTAKQVAVHHPPARVRELVEAIEAGGGQVLAPYRDPLGGHWQLLRALPLEQVGLTPFQRDLCEAHVKQLTEMVEKCDRFVDPIVAIRHDERTSGTPNGNHHLAALRGLGARSIVALLMADPEVAFQILALDTEKAHDLPAKSPEVIRVARTRAELDPRARAGPRLRARAARLPDPGPVPRATGADRRRGLPPGAAAGRRVPGLEAAAGPGGAGLRQPLPRELRRRLREPPARPARRQVRLRRDPRRDPRRDDGAGRALRPVQGRRGPGGPLGWLAPVSEAR